MEHNTKVMNFHSQCEEDVWLFNEGYLNKPGFYLDIGSADPYVNSNTAVLDQLSWRGICVEPALSVDPDLVLAYEARPCITVPKALHVYEGTCRFNIAGEAGKISDDGNSVVECTTIERIVKDFSVYRIDLLSIDVEGSEYDIISDYMKYAHNVPLPKLIIAEYVTFGVKDMRLYYFLTGLYGYKAIHKTAFNFIYERK